MSLSEESILKFQQLLQEKSDREISYAEAAEGARNLVGLVDLIMESHREDLRRKRKLAEFAKGFSLMDGHTYNCGICYAYIKNEQLWYDKWGHKCLSCQKAIDKKIVPGKICCNRDSWYQLYEFESYFKLRSQTVRKLVKQGVLKARVIPDSGFLVFLIKDNIDALPPKKDIESRPIIVRENIHSSQKWFEYKNPQETLEKYTIWPYLTAFHQSPEKP